MYICLTSKSAELKIRNASLKSQGDHNLFVCCYEFNGNMKGQKGVYDWCIWTFSDKFSGKIICWGAYKIVKLHSDLYHVNDGSLNHCRSRVQFFCPVYNSFRLLSSSIRAWKNTGHDFFRMVVSLSILGLTTLFWFSKTATLFSRHLMYSFFLFLKTCMSSHWGGEAKKK